MPQHQSTGVEGVLPLSEGEHITKGCQQRDLLVTPEKRSDPEGDRMKNWQAIPVVSVSRERKEETTDGKQ